MSDYIFNVGDRVGLLITTVGCPHVVIVRKVDKISNRACHLAGDIEDRWFSQQSGDELPGQFGVTNPPKFLCTLEES